MNSIFTVFNENKILFSFAAISDLHIGNWKANRDGSFLQKALDDLMAEAKKHDKKGLAAVIGVGDLTDTYNKDPMAKYPEIETLKALYDTSSAKDVPFIYAMGNHDHDFQRNGGSGVDLATFIKKMGNEEIHTKYDVTCIDAANGSRHAVIDGYHFLFVEPITYSSNGVDDSGAKFTPETLAWLEKTLSEVTSEHPDHYVFVMTHAMAYDTVYGSDLCTSGIYWYTKELCEVLQKYPQSVVFGGHLHFPLNDPRSIMQTAFTSLGCGSVNYMAIEPGGYEDMTAATIMKDCSRFSQGLLLQIDENGNIRITRMDFHTHALIGNAWELSHPTADGSHLNAYSRARADKDVNKAPKLSSMHVEFGELNEDGAREVTVLFAAATDDEFAHHYELSLFGKNEEKPLKTWKILSDFYRHGNPVDMKPMFTQAIGSLEPGTSYELRLKAYDSWDAESETLPFAFTVES